MSFGPSQQQQQADAYQTQYQGNLEQSQKQGQKVIDFGLGQYQQNADFQNQVMGGQNFQKLYAS